MKYLVLMALLAVNGSFLFGQAPVLLLNTASYKYHGGTNSDVIDTSSIKKLNDKFYLGKARLDNMPVLLPHGKKGNMPNPGSSLNPPENMPNFWEKRNTGPVKAIRKNNPSGFYHFPDSTGLNKKFDYRKKTGPLQLMPYKKQY